MGEIGNDFASRRNKSLIWKGDAEGTGATFFCAGVQSVYLAGWEIKNGTAMDQLLLLPQLLLIAGTGRNTGKTTLACNLIRRFCPTNPIVAIKITPHFHENYKTGKILVDKTNLIIAEETDSATGKDSSLMLKSGAMRSFFVMTTDEQLAEAIRLILLMIPQGTPMVCESGGLRAHVIPGVFLMMCSADSGKAKDRAEKLKLLADRVITFDGEKIDFDLSTIKIAENRWILKH